MPDFGLLRKMRRALVLAPVAVLRSGTTTAGATSTTSVSNLVGATPNP